MYAVDYEIQDGKIVILNCPVDAELLKIPQEEYLKFYSFLTHEKDFSMALEFFDYWGENEIINRALFIAALSQFMKCFQNCEDRIPLDDSLFDSDEDAKNAFKTFKNLRNKYIIHDDSLYDQSLVGIIISPSEKMVKEWTHINFSANTSGREYMEPLYNVITYAKNELENLIDIEGNKMLKDYREKPWSEVENMEPCQYTVPDRLK